MDRRTLLAIALCFLILFGWQKLVIEPRQQSAAPTANVTTQVAPTTATPPTTANRETPTLQTAAPDKQEPVVEKDLGVSTGFARLTSKNQILSGWTLSQYRQGIAGDSARIDLRSLTQREGGGEFAFDSPEFAYLANVQGTLVSSGQEATWTYEDANVRLVRKTEAAQDRPYLNISVSADFKNKRPAYAFVSLTGHSPQEDPEAQDRQLIYWTNKDIERVLLNDPVKLTDVATGVKWIGAANRYFVTALINDSPVEPRGLLQAIDATTGRVSMVYPMSGNSITIPLRVYFGPKDLDVLRSVEPTLDNTVDFGWFTVIAYPLLKLMKLFYGWFHNYGVSIILLTLLVKILTYPLTYKSMKSMKEMAKLQPQLQKLREKHKDDKEALNREMLTMMKSHGYNPAAGCLPILIQMPVFFALYRVLYGAIELYHAPFALWIVDLSAKDPYYVTPVLLSLLMYLQQKMTPNTATDPMQAKMMQFMPLIFGAFMLTLPAGLTLYMLVNSVASIAQQLIMNKKLDIGNVGAVARAK